MTSPPQLEQSCWRATRRRSGFDDKSLPTKTTQPAPARSNVQFIKELKMRKRNIVLSLAAAPAVAVLLSSCTQEVPGSNLTVNCTDTLTAVDATNWGVSGHGHCTLTGALHESGPEITYRAQTAEAIFIRRVITGAKGTITLVIKIPTVGSPAEPWTITSGTGAYAKLHGHGLQVVDNYTATPATFVLKGTVSHAQA